MEAEERLKAQLIKQVHKRLVDDRWGWRGTEFTNWTYCGVKGVDAYVRFTATFWCIKVHIEQEERYGLPDQVSMFAGEEAISKAVEWTAIKLLELYKKVSQRVAPYIKGHEQYLRAVQGVNMYNDAGKCPRIT